jgi:serine/threonine protein kinase
VVAVKVIHQYFATNPDFRLRLRREILAAKRVGGFWTAPIVAADAEADTPWLATAYIAGPALDEAIRSDGPFHEKSLTTLFLGLAEGLSAIHEAGVVHRDLKPSNVLLASDGPRLIDFGISRAVDATSFTQSGLVIGTPSFMSPEQANGHEVESPSDVFSLGCVIVYAALGHSPFEGPTVPAILYKIVHEEPDLGGIPARLRSLAASCLKKDAAHRPSARELIDQLGSIVDALGLSWPSDDTAESVRANSGQPGDPATRAHEAQAEMQSKDSTDTSNGGNVENISAPVAANPTGRDSTATTEIIESDSRLFNRPEIPTLPYTTEFVPSPTASQVVRNRRSSPAQSPTQPRPRVTPQPHDGGEMFFRVLAHVVVSSLALGSAIVAWMILASPSNDTAWYWYALLGFGLIITPIAARVAYDLVVVNGFGGTEVEKARKFYHDMTRGYSLIINPIIFGLFCLWGMLFENGATVSWLVCPGFYIVSEIVWRLKAKFLFVSFSPVRRLLAHWLIDAAWITAAGIAFASLNQLKWYQDVWFIVMLWGITVLLLLFGPTRRTMFARFVT